MWMEYSEEAQSIEPHRSVMNKVELGLWLCPHYFLEDAAKLAPQIYNRDNLPAFTFLDVEDASSLNKARANLYSLLIPIHDREAALGEFVEVAKEWA